MNGRDGLLNEINYEEELNHYTQDETMPIIATNTGGDFKILEAGSHVARCYGVVDLGTHLSQKWGTMQRKVRLLFEVPGETITIDGEEKPMTVSQMFTLSMSSKGLLRPALEAWRGKAFTEAEAEAFDVSKLCGGPVMITVIHQDYEGKTYANIASLAALPKGTTCPPQVNHSLIYEIAMHRGGTYNLLPEWIQKHLEKSIEFSQAPLPTGPNSPKEIGDDGFAF